MADETRDDLIKARGQNGKDEHWKPKMEVDEEEGWPHGFCISKSKTIVGTMLILRLLRA